MTSWRDRRAAARAERRARAASHTTAALDPAAVRDPLERAGGQRGTPALAAAVLMSVSAHGLAGVIAQWAMQSVPPPRDDMPIEVSVLALPEPPPPPPPPPDPTSALKPIVPPPSHAPTIAAAPVAPPLLAPLSPPPPVEAPAPAPARRVFGLEMESTSTLGAEAFATGNGQMGATGGGRPGGGAAGSGGGDGDGPGAGGTFSAPRRLSAPTPEYPAALKAQGLEGDVGLSVDISDNGHVVRVSVTSSSGRAEFDRSAIDSAARSTYAPATTNGVPVAHSIHFTVRFRLHT